MWSLAFFVRDTQSSLWILLFLLPGQRGHDDAIRGLGDAYAICDLWSAAQGDLRGMKEAVAICDASSARRVSTNN